MCAAKIFGVEILNEGQGISIDDAVSEMQATFVARAVEPMQAVPSPYTGTLGSLNSSSLTSNSPPGQSWLCEPITFLFARPGLFVR